MYAFYWFYAGNTSVDKEPNFSSKRTEFLS